MNSQVRRCSQMLVVVLLLAISGSALAAGATKDEAVAIEGGCGHQHRGR